MGIEYENKEYCEYKDRWQKIDNVCEGHEVDQYLITLNPDDTSKENTTRNTQYKERSVFYPISGRTAEGLVSLMFAKQPKLEVPTQMEYMRTNADGAGVSIFQQSKDVAGDVVKVARAGLFTTYPTVDRELSAADMATGNFFSTIHEYEASQIYNWETAKFGSVVKLSLVALSESVCEAKDGDDYEKEEIEQKRELKLTVIDGSPVFSMQLWRKSKEKGMTDEWVKYEGEVFPTDGYGKLWDEIPFSFVGAESNSSSVDDSPMYGMVKMNIGHYRNSADLEDSGWYCGQNQPWMSGVDQNHLDLMKENQMYIGSRQLLGVPSGESFGIESPEPNPMVRQLMLDKLDGMIGMGARYIQPNGKEKREVEAIGDEAIAHSTLSSISMNVSEAYTQALKWAARYMKLAEDNILYETSREFVQPNATAQEIQAMVAGFLGGAIPMSAYLAWLKKVDIEDKERTIEEFAEDVGGANMPDLDEDAQ